MHVLIIKLSNMRDVINTLPALSDAAGAIRNIKFDWLVNEQCSDIAEMHPNIRRVITMNTSKFDVTLAKSLLNGEFAQLKRQIQHTRYDLVIDAQGNELSALLARLANGPANGYDQPSLQNGLLSKTYAQAHYVSKAQHILDRTRQLFAQSLGYSIVDKAANYGIVQTNSGLNGKKIKKQKQLMFLIGTDWDSKRWPVSSWIDLANSVTEKGLKIVIPWHSSYDHKLASEIKKACKHIDQIVIPKQMNLMTLTQKMASVMSIVSVDSGLSHLAVAMEIPVITLFGPSNPTLQGCQGNKCVNLSVQYDCSPCEKKSCKLSQDKESPLCYENLTPQRVHKHLIKLLNSQYRSSAAVKGADPIKSVKPVQNTQKKPVGQTSRVA